MSERILIKEAKHRKEVFNSLHKWLELVKSTLKRIDPEAGVYIFGSVAENRYNYSSDIDLLIVTWNNQEKIIAEL
ncbi:MAG: nucleotidyltransferase domain-containing protein [Nitrososphaerales archaeon]